MRVYRPLLRWRRGEHGADVGAALAEASILVERAPAEQRVVVRAALGLRKTLQQLARCGEGRQRHLRGGAVVADPGSFIYCRMSSQHRAGMTSESQQRARKRAKRGERGMCGVPRVHEFHRHAPFLGQRIALLEQVGDGRAILLRGGLDREVVLPAAAAAQGQQQGLAYVTKPTATRFRGGEGGSGGGSYDLPAADRLEARQRLRERRQQLLCTHTQLSAEAAGTAGASPAAPPAAQPAAPAAAPPAAAPRTPICPMARLRERTRMINSRDLLTEVTAGIFMYLRERTRMISSSISRNAGAILSFA